MQLIKQPKPDPSLEPFNNGVAVIKQKGNTKGYIATSVSKFWSPFSPFSFQWWAWSVIVWNDGSREQRLEDYAPWSYVNDMREGKFKWNDETYSIEWLPKDEAEAKKKELRITSEDF